MSHQTVTRLAACWQYGGNSDIDGHTGNDEGVGSGIVHSRLQVGQSLFGEIALVEQIVFIFLHLTLYLHHVGAALFTQLKHTLRLD